MNLLQREKDFKKINAPDSKKFCLNESIIIILKTLNPIAPHISEFLWNHFDADKLMGPIESSWPKVQENLLEISEFELVIQINGKLRARLNVAANIDEKTLKELAFKEPKIAKLISDQKIKKTIIVPRKLINIVT